MGIALLSFRTARGGLAPLSVLVISLLGAAALTLREPLASDASVTLVVWGAVASLVMHLVGRLSRPDHATPELRRLHDLRMTIGTEIDQLREAGNGPGRRQLAPILDEAEAILDEEIFPAARSLSVRESDLTHHLTLYERGRLVRPNPRVLDRVRAEQAADLEAIRAAVESVANAEATLFPLTHRVHDSDITSHLSAWVNELIGIREQLAQALVGWRPVASSIALGAPPITETGSLPVLSRPNFEKLVEQALRRLNEPGQLAKSELISLLPRTLAAANERTARNEIVPTPLEQTRVLREVLSSGIERLKPSGSETGSAGGRQYEILHQEYRLGIQTKQIRRRLEISPPTFFRYRKEAIAALSQDLMLREDASTEIRRPRSLSPIDGESGEPNTARIPPGASPGGEVRG
jgi:hypothetical protein